VYSALDTELELLEVEDELVVTMGVEVEDEELEDEVKTAEEETATELEDEDVLIGDDVVAIDDEAVLTTEVVVDLPERATYAPAPATTIITMTMTAIIAGAIPLFGLKIKFSNATMANSKRYILISKF
jgi:hypothetical protein